MKIPEGWPTEEMIQASIDNLPNVNREDVIFALKASIKAAPPNHAPEDDSQANPC